MPENDLNSEARKSPEIILSNTPTSSTDYIGLAQAKNGSILMQLVSILPEHSIENHRTVLSKEFVEPFIEMLCDLADHYPEKPKKRTVKRRKKTKKQSS